VPAPLDLRALRGQLREAAALGGGTGGAYDVVPPLLRGLVPAAALAVPAARGGGQAAGDAGGGGLRERLAGLPEEERAEATLGFVREVVAAVLGHPGPGTVPPERGLFDLGLDSLTAVELRNRLVATTGLALPTSVVFDHPTPALLAGCLREELAGSAATAAAGSLLTQLDRLAESISAVPDEADARGLVADRLRELLDALRPEDGSEGAPDGGPGADGVADRLGAASDDEIFAFIDREL
jgi:acyl carrier protein